MKRIISIAIILIVTATVLCSCGQQPKGIGEAGISAEEFDSLHLGMSKDRVIDIIGGKGDLISESKDEDDDYLYTVLVYRFNGEISGYADIEFTIKTHKGYITNNFQTFSLTQKTKYDLQ